MTTHRRIYMTAIAIAVTTVLTAAIAQDGKIYEPHVLPDMLVLEPLTDQGLTMDVDLIVKGPEDFYQRKSFDAGELIEFAPAMVSNGAMADGTYHYEVRIMGIQGMNSNRETGEIHSVEPGLRGISGAFSIKNGQIVSPDQEEEAIGKSSQGVTATGSTTNAQPEQGTRQLIAENLYVDGRACIGTECVNKEILSPDTLRLKEDNVRLKFEDTSDSSNFPTNDWELTANDNTDGGANRFSILDVDAGRQIFTVEAGAPSNSLYVDDGGQIGLGTSTPALQAHIVDGNTPAVRLEQDGSSGFAAQAFDVGSNEANFFVRDVTNGSTLPLRIRPGAPSSSVDITANGDVGIGLANATAPLHVRRSDDTFEMLFLEQTNGGVVQDRNMMQLDNNGGIRFQFDNNALGTAWRFQAATGNQDVFEITKVGTGTIEMELDASGNLTTAGVINGGSSRAVKHAIEPINGSDLLDGLRALKLAEWTYRHDSDGIRHLGPMAEDFYAAFGLGVDEKHIAPHDLAGVALASAKELAEQHDRQNNTISRQQQLIEAQERRIDELEAQNRVIRSSLADLEDIRARLDELQSDRAAMRVALKH